MILAREKLPQRSRTTVGRECILDLQVHRWNVSGNVRGMSRWVVIVVVMASAYRLGDTAPSPSHGRADNMPRGWTWPPSKTMAASARSCERRLDELGVTWHFAKREGHVVDAIAVPDGQIGGINYVGVYDHDVPVMDCQLVLALATFAPRLYELGVREVHVGSIYRWSKVRVGGKTKDMLSRHALGLAMDVVSFVDDTGREAIVARDYKNDDELLLSIERGIDDSGIFRSVLTPKNDPISHKDHFHVEANPDYTDALEERPSS